MADETDSKNAGGAGAADDGGNVGTGGVTGGRGDRGAGDSGGDTGGNGGDVGGKAAQEREANAPQTRRATRPDAGTTAEAVKAGDERLVVGGTDNPDSEEIAAKARGEHMPTNPRPQDLAAEEDGPKGKRGK